MAESTGNSEALRKDYEFNHSILRDSFFAYLSEKKRFPTNTELARRTGFSEKTVRNHLKSFDLREITEPSKLFAENVIISLIRRIQRTGDPSSVKLYFLLVFGLQERGYLSNKESQIYNEFPGISQEDLEQAIADIINNPNDEIVAQMYNMVCKPEEENGNILPKGDTDATGFK
jgi:predicted transcriptional regulator